MTTARFHCIVLFVGLIILTGCANAQDQPAHVTARAARASQSVLVDDGRAGLSLNRDDPEMYESNLFLFSLMMAGLIALCVIGAIAVAVGVLFAVTIAAIGMLSVVINAVIVGLIGRSVRSGLLALLIQCGGLAGFSIGLGIFCAAKWLLHYEYFAAPEFAISVLTGSVLGVLSTWLCFNLLATLVGNVKTAVMAIVGSRATAVCKVSTCNTFSVP